MLPRTCPRLSTCLGLLAIGATACGGASLAGAPIVSTSTSEVVETPGEVRMTEPEPPLAIPRVDPCSEGPEYDLVASIAEGAIARRADAAAPPADGATLADLDHGLYSLTSTGERVASFMRLELGDPAETFLASVSFHESEPIRDSGVLEHPNLHLLRCTPSEGWRPAVAVPLWERAATWITGRELVAIGSMRFVTLRVVSDFVASDERREDAFAIAHPDVPLVASPTARPTHGIVRIYGAVASTHLADGASELTTESAYDATGWFVSGDHGVYVSFVRETRPGPRGFRVRSFARPLATVEGGELHAALADSGFAPFYLVLGRRSPPSLCTSRRDVVCRRLTMLGGALPELDYEWVAGPFSPDDPSLATIAPRAARLLYVAQGGTPPRRGPDGRAPLTSF